VRAAEQESRNQWNQSFSTGQSNQMALQNYYTTTSTSSSPTTAYNAALLNQIQNQNQNQNKC